MKCANCPYALVCKDSARTFGGCDMDGSDDFGSDPIETKVNPRE